MPYSSNRPTLQQKREARAKALAITRQYGQTMTHIEDVLIPRLVNEIDAYRIANPNGRITQRWLRENGLDEIYRAYMVRGRQVMATAATELIDEGLQVSSKWPITRRLQKANIVGGDMILALLRDPNRITPEKIRRRVAQASSYTGWRTYTIVNTETNRRVRQEHWSRMAEDPNIVGWEWKANPDCCAFCRANAGTKHNLDTDISEHTHPNCRCWMEPITISDAFDEVDKQVLEDLGWGQHGDPDGPLADVESKKRKHPNIAEVSGKLELPDKTKLTIGFKDSEIRELKDLALKQAGLDKEYKNNKRKKQGKAEVKITSRMTMKTLFRDEILRMRRRRNR